MPYLSVLHVNVGSRECSLFSKIVPVFRAMIYVILLSTNQEEVPFGGECTGAVRESVISAFRQGVNEIFALLGSYAA
jgi:hypothetical protein